MFYEFFCCYWFCRPKKLSLFTCCFCSTIWLKGRAAGLFDDLLANLFPPMFYSFKIALLTDSIFSDGTLILLGLRLTPNVGFSSIL